MKERPLLDWYQENIPDEGKVWKAPAINQINFIRQKIPLALGVRDNHEVESLKREIKVVSTHTSKSILLPVYRVIWRGITFIMRDNFHDWKISVNSDIPIGGLYNLKLFDLNQINRSIYCEGFAEDWVYGSWADNKLQFTAELHSQFDVYCLVKIVAAHRWAEEVYHPQNKP